MALDIGDCSFRPHVCSHIPGLENTVADALSRLFQPGANIPFPVQLRSLNPVQLPVRDRSYYVALEPPTVPLRSGDDSGSGACHAQA